jgi:hypothetical protein
MICISKSFSSADRLHTMALLLYIHQLNHQVIEDFTGAKLLNIGNGGFLWVSFIFMTQSKKQH